jgi:hypothetical protein
MPPTNSRRPTTAQILSGIGVLLLVTLLFGTLLARQLLIFTPKNMIFESDTNYTLTTDAADSLAIFANVITTQADIPGYALLAAETITVNGEVGRSLTGFAQRVIVNGSVGGDAVLVGEVVTVTGDVRGDAVVLAGELVLEVPPGGEMTACAENIRNPAAARLSPCDANAARVILSRAGAQLANVWIIATITDPSLLRQLQPVLPIPAALVLVGVGALVVVMLPAPVGRMASAVRAYPGRMFITGVLVALLMIGITVALLVIVTYIKLLGVVLMPLYLLVLLGFGLLLVGGWVSVALFVGEWVTRRSASTMIPPIVQIVIGGALLMAVALVLYVIPYGVLVNQVLFLGLGLSGLGASYITCFGGQGWRMKI